MLQVRNIEKYYGSKNNVTKALDRVSFEVDDGEFIAIMGASGSGKTTLLNCISCYIPADSGSIRLGSQELARLDEDTLAAVRNKKLGFVFQDFLLLDEPTSNLDSLNEGVILKAVRAECKDKTVLLVSHRKSTMAAADISFSVESGRLS